jgi:hypothetical protein
MPHKADDRERTAEIARWPIADAAFAGSARATLRAAARAGTDRWAITKVLISSDSSGSFGFAHGIRHPPPAPGAAPPQGKPPGRIQRGLNRLPLVRWFRGPCDRGNPCAQVPGGSRRARTVARHRVYENTNQLISAGPSGSFGLAHTGSPRRFVARSSVRAGRRYRSLGILSRNRPSSMLIATALAPCQGTNRGEVGSQLRRPEHEARGS